MEQRGAAMGPGKGCVFRRVEWMEQRHTGLVRDQGHHVKGRNPGLETKGKYVVTGPHLQHPSLGPAGSHPSLSPSSTKWRPW